MPQLSNTSMKLKRKYSWRFLTNTSVEGVLLADKFQIIDSISHSFIKMCFLHIYYPISSRQIVLLLSLLHNSLKRYNKYNGYNHFWSQNENQQKTANVYLLNSTVMELTKNAILIFLAMLYTWKIKQLFASINQKYSEKSFCLHTLSWKLRDSSRVTLECNPGVVLINKSWRFSLDKSPRAPPLKKRWEKKQ